MLHSFMPAQALAVPIISVRSPAPPRFPTTRCTHRRFRPFLEGPYHDGLLCAVHERVPLLVGDHQVPMRIAHGSARILLGAARCLADQLGDVILEPGGGHTMVGLIHARIAFSLGSAITLSIRSSTTVAMLYAARQLTAAERGSSERGCWEGVFDIPAGTATVNEAW